MLEKYFCKLLCSLLFSLRRQWLSPPCTQIFFLFQWAIVG